MNQRIKTKCSGCGKRLSVPAEKSGRQLKCPDCGGRVRVPESSTLSSSGNPYQSTGPAEGELPPRKKKKQKEGRKSAGGSNLPEDPGSRKMLMGFGIIVASLVSNVVMKTITGPLPNTNAGRGQAFGQGLATVLGILTGIVLLIIGFIAKRKNRNR